ncbi:AMP-binding enzyme, partial [Toxoplasma gondii p89]
GDIRRTLALTMLTIRHAFSSVLGCVWKVVFTSGTTGRPKGAILTNKYTTSFWRLLADVAEEEAAASGRPERSAVPKRDFRLLTPLVSRHIDFLRELVDTNRLTGVSVHRLAHALKPKEVVLLLGSAPVGLTTVQTFLRLLGKLPAIRFGSTETCLQVSPTHFSRPRSLCRCVRDREREESRSVATQLRLPVSRNKTSLHGNVENAHSDSPCTGENLAHLLSSESDTKEKPMSPDKNRK